MTNAKHKRLEELAARWFGGEVLKREELYEFINALYPRAKLAGELTEVLELVMGKNSTNFKLKAPDYLVDKCDNIIEKARQIL